MIDPFQSRAWLVIIIIIIIIIIATKRWGDVHNHAKAKCMTMLLVNLMTILKSDFEEVAIIIFNIL